MRRWRRSLTATGDSTHDVSNAVVATKIRILAETPSRPAFGIRFATKLPNASNEKGIDLDTTDFSGTLLVAKTVQSIRVVGNIGAGDSHEPDVRCRTERRVPVRIVVRTGGDAGDGSRRRTERSRLDARRARFRGPRPAGF